MNKFMTGIIAGSALGIAGAAMMLSDRKTRRVLAKGRSKVMRKAEDVIDNVADIF